MTKKLKLLLCLSAFAVCTSLASADTFSDLISNLNSLMKKSKPATGNIPEGKEILPIIYGYTSSKYDNGKVGLLGIDIENKSYLISQVSYFKGPLNVKMRQDSYIHILEEDGKFSVSTLKSIVYSVDKEGKPKSAGTEYLNASLTKINKDFVLYFEKLFEMTDAEYESLREYAYTSPEIINAVVSKATNKLKAKMWLKNNPPEGRKTKLDFTVNNVDESNKDGYAYKISGTIYTIDGDSFIVDYYSNDDKYIEQKSGEFISVEGILDGVSFNSLFSSITYLAVKEAAK
ncbi:MAG: hypothetical protein IIW80_01630 [Treponema sp.]|nr:hypothetical protein [Treponema sp.]